MGDWPKAEGSVSWLVSGLGVVVRLISGSSSQRQATTRPVRTDDDFPSSLYYFLLVSS